MARSQKLEKNLSKVQDMLDGNHNRKLQIGYGDKADKIRKVGDTWTDSEGYEWEQKEGFKVKKSNTPAKGIADTCPDCESFVTKPWDKDSYKHNGRCYYCQIDFEAQFPRTFKNEPNLFKQFEGEEGAKKWNKLSKKKKKEIFESNLSPHEKYQIERLENYIKEYQKEEKIWKKEMQEEKVFDKSVANAMANENVEMQINKNKS